MNRTILRLVLAGLLALAGPLAAVIGVPDNVPAATLLLPYFEVGPNINTLFSINNASAAAILVKVTVWSDQSVPVLDFDVYLTGYDVQTISMRDILEGRHLPVTASAGQDPADIISPKGPVSQDINFASCASALPYDPMEISVPFRDHLQAWLKGEKSPYTGNCAGAKTGDGHMRGYITMDTVNACNLFFPAEWAFYAAFITNQNVLWGDWAIVDSNPTTGNFAQGGMLVHIEACPTCFLPGDHTFYGRYNDATAADAREPLPTTWGSRFINGAAFTGGTGLLVWREGNSAASAYDCKLAGPPSWYPLDLAQIVIFDEEEQPVTVEECPSGDPTCEQIVQIPNETQRVDVAADLLAPFQFGWVYLNLQHTDLLGDYGDTAAQSWVIVVMDATGLFSVGYDVLHYDNANSPVTTLIPVP